MIEVEVFGLAAVAQVPQAPTPAELRRLCAMVASSRGVAAGHVAVEFVDAARIAELNSEHRGRTAPTDVLSFPIDGLDANPARPSAPDGVPCELGDIVICPEHTADLREAVVHGMLHLLGMDHEADNGEMLALQAQLLTAAR
jgi:probable rRNA maturation factor